MWLFTKKKGAEMFNSAAYVFIGAGMGACLRWLAGVALGGLYSGMHLGTLAANIAGCFLAGLASAFFTRHGTALPAEARLLIVTGFLGGLTTFSAFSMEIHALFLTGRHAHAILTLTCNLVGSLAATLVGFWLYNRLAA